MKAPIITLLLSTTAVSAGGLAPPIEPYTIVPETNWTGFYGGLSYNRTNVERSRTRTLITSSQQPDQVVVDEEYTEYTYECAPGGEKLAYYNWKCSVGEFAWNNSPEIDDLERVDEPWNDDRFKWWGKYANTTYDPQVVKGYHPEVGNEPESFLVYAPEPFRYTITQEGKGVQYDRTRAQHTLVDTRVIQTFMTIPGEVTRSESTSTDEYSISESGVGFHTGYRHQWDTFVAGVEASAVSSGDDDYKILEGHVGIASGDALVYLGAGGGKYSSDKFGTDDIFTLSAGVDYRIAENMTIGAKATQLIFDNSHEDEGTNVGVRVSFQF